MKDTNRRNALITNSLQGPTNRIISDMLCVCNATCIASWAYIRARILMSQAVTLLTSLIR
ncbi:hypothetical protein V6x_32450 [Gimesia chilikensis]|uniref:Uncharacterized protein n=1 Tax=Gimesia chilikensis TaxID=2605989 RepID=A0A517WE44_9PLAN|nr:hypothetical protein V6x_32450 [Gimesia chilikensis]